jgi:hypothetical protein
MVITRKGTVQTVYQIAVSKQIFQNKKPIANLPNEHELTAESLAGEELCDLPIFRLRQWSKRIRVIAFRMRASRSRFSPGGG